MRRLLALAGLCGVSAYCDGGNVYAGDSTLGGVSLPGEAQSINDPANVCPNPTGIQDRTSFKAELRVGSKYTLTFQAATCNYGYARVCYAFIDFNKNDIYDANELLGGVAIDDRLAPVDISFEFTPPSETSVLGDTRMRILVVENGSPLYNPCLVFGYGGVKEYSISLVSRPPGLSCCLPTTYSSIARIRNGATVNVVYQWQNFQKQAYLQRTEIPGSESSNSMLCLAAAQACWGFTETTCQKYSFMWPAQECPGSNTSKFAFDSTSSLIPGLTLNIYTQPEVAITTVPLDTWCVYDAIVPNTAYTYWDLEPPAAVFVVPSYCSQDSTSKPLPESAFFGPNSPLVRAK